MVLTQELKPFLKESTLFGYRLDSSTLEEINFYMDPLTPIPTLKGVENLSSQGGADFFSFYRSLVDSYAVGRIIPMDVSLLGMRSYYLSRLYHMPVSMAVFSVLLDRFLDVVILLVMAFPSFLFITRTASTTWSVVILVLILVGQVFILFWKKGDSFHFLYSFYRTFIVKRFQKIPFVGPRLKAEADLSEEGTHFSLSSTFRIMGWNCIKYVFLCLRFFFTGHALGIEFSLLTSFFFIPFIQLTGLINITPGGLGVVEMGTYGALFLMGIPKAQILVFVFGQRILLLVVFFSLFVLYRVFYFLRSRVYFPSPSACPPKPFAEPGEKERGEGEGFRRKRDHEP